MYDLFALTCGGYRFLCNPKALPDLIDSYRARAVLVEEITLGTAYREARLETCFLGVARNGAWPFLVIIPHYYPAGGIYPGALLVPETHILFVGAGENVLAYTLDKPSRLWRDGAEAGFHSWQQHGEYVLMSAELEFAAWDLHGKKLWTMFVEPPWEYSVEGEMVHLEVMFKKSQFPITSGPSHGKK